MSEVRGSMPGTEGTSTIGCYAVAVFLVAVPILWLMALALFWAGSIQATSFDGPIPVSADELRSGRLLVIGAGLCASAPFAVAAWRLRQDHPAAFAVLAFVAALIMVASLGWALSLPHSSDYTVF